MVIDFFTEVNGPLVPQLNNRIYFQAWATKERADVYDFKGASLKATTANNAIVTLLSNVSTEHRGKGTFSFRHSHTFTEVYLEINLNNSLSLRRTLSKQLVYRPFDDRIRPIYN